MPEPRRFLLLGHGGFYNRGCEALVRTTVAMLRAQFPGSEIVLSSQDAEVDRRHSAAEGIAVSDPLVRRWSPEWFGWQVRKLLRQPIPEIERLPRELRDAMRTADAVLQIGGDNFTSDYGLTTDSALLGLNEIAFALETPLVIWGASIGPFDSADLEEAVLSQLRRAALVTVRESLTDQYLAGHGIRDNVVRVADPAFLLEPDPVDLSALRPATERVLAINASALSCANRSDGDLQFGRRLVEAVIDEVLHWDDWGILLVPHVVQPPHNDDHQYLAGIVDSVDRPGRVRLLPPLFDARQTKHVIAQCDALMAARTHATIAGFSSAVPTISLAYSRKAHGINLDLFGHDEWLVDIVEMEEVDQAVALVRRLADELGDVSAHLRERLPEVKEAAIRGSRRLAEIVGEGAA